MDYRFRVRENDGRVVVRPHIKRKEVVYDSFSRSSVPMGEHKYRRDSHTIIKRPPFPSLEGAAEKYLDRKDNKKEENKQYKITILYELKRIIQEHFGKNGYLQAGNRCAHTCFKSGYCTRLCNKA